MGRYPKNMAFRLKLLCLFILILIGCYNVPDIDYINVKHSTALAQKQDLLIHKIKIGDSIPEYEADSLDNNIWFKVAQETTPSNLTIRQMCLIDLINKESKYYVKIYKTLRKLSYQDTTFGSLYSEGYSYWEYTYNILKIWIKNFDDVPNIEQIKQLVFNIKYSFILTSYYYNFKWYPAPFGDLRHEPLSDELQNMCIGRIIKQIKYSFVEINIRKSNEIIYLIKGIPIGLNTHIPKDTFYVEIRNGKSNFKFYEGYTKKYSSKKEEIKDIFDPKRLKSLKNIK